jgi:hypothetical protein
MAHSAEIMTVDWVMDTAQMNAMSEWRLGVTIFVSIGTMCCFSKMASTDAWEVHVLATAIC